MKPIELNIVTGWGNSMGSEVHWGRCGTCRKTRASSMRRNNGRNKDSGNNGNNVDSGYKMKNMGIERNSRDGVISGGEDMWLRRKRCD